MKRKWIVATVHAGMGLDHGILLIEAQGTNIINLKIPGCRPCLSPDGKQIAWGSDDHELNTAPIDLESDAPSVGTWTLHIKDEKNKMLPWAHLDVAGTAMDSNRTDINQSWASGWGVRLLDRLVADNFEKGDK